MGDSPGDETGCSLNPAEPHPSALWLFPKQRVPQRINRVIFARRIDFFRVARGVNQRGQSANQVRAAAAKDSQASASPAVAQRPDARVSRSSQRAANQAPSQPASTGYPCRIGMKCDRVTPENRDCVGSRANEKRRDVIKKPCPA
jgi:hypothetical protein